MTTRIIVVGALNTDIVASGLSHIPSAGKYAVSHELAIVPGGKAHNIAVMAAALLDPGAVAIVSRTATDHYGLWRAPMESLDSAGVTTTHVIQTPAAGKLPGLALIGVDVHGANQIIAAPGASDDFSPADITKATSLFQESAQANGILAITLEPPLSTVAAAVQLASANRLRVICDPGGLHSSTNELTFLNQIDLIKPNQQECHRLTGVQVTNEASAARAGEKLRERGVPVTLITAGSLGAFLVTKDSVRHIPAVHLPLPDGRNETGCGDQLMAVLCTRLLNGASINSAVNDAVVAASIQYHRSRNQPVTNQEIQETHTVD